eukprot:187937_1
MTAFFATYTGDDTLPRYNDDNTDTEPADNNGDESDDMLSVTVPPPMSRADDDKTDETTTTTPIANIPIYSIDRPLQSAASNPYPSVSSFALSPTAANPPPPTLDHQSVTSRTPDLNQQTMDQRASMNALYDEDEINTDTDDHKTDDETTQP